MGPVAASLKLKTLNDSPYCKEPRTLQEISEHLGYSDKYRMKRFYIDPLLGDVLTMTSKESKTDPNQKYVVKKELTI